MMIEPDSLGNSFITGLYFLFQLSLALLELEPGSSGFLWHQTSLCEVAMSPRLCNELGENVINKRNEGVRATKTHELDERGFSCQAKTKQKRLL